MLYDIETVLPVSCVAGYNHLDVVEHLLEHQADVNAKDKGGLIPLHNAASFGVSLQSVVWLVAAAS